MREYLLKRVLLFLPTLVLASMLIFVIVRALPGDVTGVLLGGEGEALRPELVTALRAELGLDEPLVVQYLQWLGSVLSGEFGGRSLATREPIADVVARALPVTATLSLYALLLAIAGAVPLGAWAASRAGSVPDLLVRSSSLLGVALPGFWVALLALLALVQALNWSPPLVYYALWRRPLEHLEIMALPALVLAWELGAHLTRVTRAATLEALGQDHVRTAVGKGLSRSAVLFRHALRSALVPVLTVLGVHLGALLGGVVVLESVFGLPGLGRALVDAVVGRDYPVVQGLALLFVALALLANLVMDLLYAYLDPRISYGA